MPLPACIACPTTPLHCALLLDRAADGWAAHCRLCLGGRLPICIPCHPETAALWSLTTQERSLLLCGVLHAMQALADKLAVDVTEQRQAFDVALDVAVADAACNKVRRAWLPLGAHGPPASPRRRAMPACLRASPHVRRVRESALMHARRTALAGELSLWLIDHDHAAF